MKVKRLKPLACKVRTCSGYRDQPKTDTIGGASSFGGPTDVTDRCPLSKPIIMTMPRQTSVAGSSSAATAGAGKQVKKEDFEREETLSTDDEENNDGNSGNGKNADVGNDKLHTTVIAVEERIMQYVLLGINHDTTGQASLISLVVSLPSSLPQRACQAVLLLLNLKKTKFRTWTPLLRGGG